ncbi:MAG: hypothetical protein AAGE99_01560 [Chlamydiota bacterium]
MEINEINYVDYSSEECDKIRGEYNDLKTARDRAIDRLEKTDWKK